MKFVLLASPPVLTEELAFMHFNPLLKGSVLRFLSIPKPTPVLLLPVARRGCSVLQMPLLSAGAGATQQLFIFFKKGATAFFPPSLLQIFQDASVTEIVDVPAEVHQVGVDVRGHTAVGGGGEVRPEGHHAGPATWGAFGMPLYQGTKSEGGN